MIIPTEYHKESTKNGGIEFSPHWSCTVSPVQQSSRLPVVVHHRALPLRSSGWNVTAFLFFSRTCSFLLKHDPKSLILFGMNFWTFEKTTYLIFMGRETKWFWFLYFFLLLGLWTNHVPDSLKEFWLDHVGPLRILGYLGLKPAIATTLAGSLLLLGDEISKPWIERESLYIFPYLH